jgi:hypothetical protein
LINIIHLDIRIMYKRVLPYNLSHHHPRTLYVVHKISLA